MRSDYPFEGETTEELYRASESSPTGLEVWCREDDFPEGWETADVAMDPEAFEATARELLRVVRILDQWQDLGKKIRASYPAEINSPALARIKELLDQEVGRE